MHRFWLFLFGLSVGAVLHRLSIGADSFAAIVWMALPAAMVGLTWRNHP